MKKFKDLSENTRLNILYFIGFLVFYTAAFFILKKLGVE